MNKEKRKQIREVEAFPITSSLALKFALEDAETSHFIKANFSYPEQRPQIISRTQLSERRPRYRWIVEFIEKIPVSLNGKNGMMNIARIEIDPFNGKVIDRRFFKNVFEEEYKRAICQSFKPPHR
ncbi:MAG: hypothetical protein JSV46_05670 [Candidatus Aminicenantes bacterium]|nr:MAG: hypothetical protein JSV46_05670 [Candidatus Aminicenantes bacterium]